jgi:hypothetical protein
VRKALAAGLFMNAAQLVETAVEVQLSDVHDTGINKYRLVRQGGPGEARDACMDRPLCAANKSSRGACGRVVSGIAVPRPVRCGSVVKAQTVLRADVCHILPDMAFVSMRDGQHSRIAVASWAGSTGGMPAKLRIHPSSVLWRVAAPWVVFYSAQQGDSGWHDMQELLTIEPDWLPELAPQMFYARRGI